MESLEQSTAISELQQTSTPVPKKLSSEEIKMTSIAIGIFGIIMVFLISGFYLLSGINTTPTSTNATEKIELAMVQENIKGAGDMRQSPPLNMETNIATVSSTIAPTKTLTPSPTYTPIPTNTPNPTDIPSPNPSNNPTSSPTPPATSPAIPTNTIVPSTTIINTITPTSILPTIAEQ